MPVILLSSCTTESDTPLVTTEPIVFTNELLFQPGVMLTDTADDNADVLKDYCRIQITNPSVGSGLDSCVITDSSGNQVLSSDEGTLLFCSEKTGCNNTGNDNQCNITGSFNLEPLMGETMCSVDIALNCNAKADDRLADFDNADCSTTLTYYGQTREASYSSDMITILRTWISIISELGEGLNPSQPNKVFSKFVDCDSDSAGVCSIGATVSLQGFNIYNYLDNRGLDELGAAVDLVVKSEDTLPNYPLINITNSDDGEQPCTITEVEGEELTILTNIWGDQDTLCYGSVDVNSGSDDATVGGNPLELHIDSLDRLAIAAYEEKDGVVSCLGVIYDNDNEIDGGDATSDWYTVLDSYNCDDTICVDLTSGTEDQCLEDNLSDKSMNKYAERIVKFIQGSPFYEALMLPYGFTSDKMTSLFACNDDDGCPPIASACDDDDCNEENEGRFNTVYTEFPVYYMIGQDSWSDPSEIGNDNQAKILGLFFGGAYQNVNDDGYQVLVTSDGGGDESTDSSDINAASLFNYQCDNGDSGCPLSNSDINLLSFDLALFDGTNPTGSNDFSWSETCSILGFDVADDTDSVTSSMADDTVIRPTQYRDADTIPRGKFVTLFMSNANEDSCEAIFYPKALAEADDNSCIIATSFTGTYSDDGSYDFSQQSGYYYYDLGNNKLSVTTQLNSSETTPKFVNDFSNIISRNFLQGTSLLGDESSCSAEMPANIKIEDNNDNIDSKYYIASPPCYAYSSPDAPLLPLSMLCTAMNYDDSGAGTTTSSPEDTSFSKKVSCPLQCGPMPDLAPLVPQTSYSE